MHRLIGKKICEDNFICVAAGHHRNMPRHINSPVKNYHHEPSLDSTSGMEYVLLEDGQVFERYDCYVWYSPYGWKKSNFIFNKE